MTDIADVPFAQVSEEEKKMFDGKIRQEGSWMGYKLRQFWVSRYTFDRARLVLIDGMLCVRPSTMAFATR